MLIPGSHYLFPTRRQRNVKRDIYKVKTGQVTRKGAKRIKYHEHRENVTSAAWSRAARGCTAQKRARPAAGCGAAWEWTAVPGPGPGGPSRLTAEGRRHPAAVPSRCILGPTGLFLSVLSREPGAQHPGRSARAALPGGIETRAVRPRPPGGRTRRVRAVLREAVPESCGVSGASEHEVPSPEGGPLGPPAPRVRLGMGDGCSRGRPGLRASAREGGGHRAG